MCSPCSCVRPEALEAPGFSGLRPPTGRVSRKNRGQGDRGDNVTGRFSGRIRGPSTCATAPGDAWGQMRPGLVSGLAGRVAGAKTGGVLRPRPSEGRRTLGRRSALALERPLGFADERVAGGFPLDVALASPGELLGENRVHDPDVVPFDIVLVAGAGLDEVVALDALRLPRE